MMLPLILASTSPYRKELLARLAIPFEAMAPDVDEDSWKSRGHSPETLALELARAKAVEIHQRFPQAVVLGSDQVLEFQGEAFGKPGSEERAIEQLTMLSGQTHRLLTAVAIASPAGCEVFLNCTSLTMRLLKTEEIERYVRHDQPWNCAGSYKLESLGISLFERVETDDQTAIIGLPLLETGQRLRKLGFQLP